MEQFDFVIIGSGFGGSVAALRLVEKGHRVLVLEQGRRFSDSDFPRTNWRIWDYLWMPSLRLRGFMRLTFLKEAMVLDGCGVGGGSLVYANVLMEPDAELFDEPEWTRLVDWRTILRPYYETARAMLGVAVTPKLGQADLVLRQVADSYGLGGTFRPTQVGVFFGQPGVEQPDPYFGGEGPARAGCIFCGGCMVGCRYNAKNTLVKNYLYLAEKRGATVRPESRVTEIRINDDSAAGHRFTVVARPATRRGPTFRVMADHVVVAAGTLGTLELLLRCRDEIGSLPRLSSRLGAQVRTNSESLLGSGARRRTVDYSEGIAISADVRVDSVTHVQPVRYAKGSSFMRLLATPLIEAERQPWGRRLIRLVRTMLRHPLEFLDSLAGPAWAERTTILLVMQRLENFMTLRWQRGGLSLFGRGLRAERDATRPVPGEIRLAHKVVRDFASRTDGVPMGTVGEALFNLAATAHLIGGCPMGLSADDGVVDLGCRVHNYPGLYIIDGSVLPANPGINPSLTIAALAEYAVSLIPPKGTAAASRS